MSFEKTKLFLSIIFIPIFIILMSVAGLGFLLLTLPNVADLKKCIKTSMYQLDLCPKNSSYTRLNEISPHLIDAVIVSEDSTFFNHDGFDWFEIKESFVTNWNQGRLARGGSTITQQLVKNVFLEKEKSLIRKLREAILTKQVEGSFSKQEIIEKYLNVVEFGPKIYGIKSASRYYFGKLPSQLNILESAFLAFLLPNPTLHHQYFKKGKLTDYATKRLLNICTRLYHFKKISESDWEIANFRISEFPWKNLVWQRTDLMETVDQILEDETGEIKPTLPNIEDNLPESDPDLPSSESEEIEPFDQ